MSEVLEFAARLSRVVGARPAGTEEEQQASFFIEEVMTEAGLDTSVEEFNCNPNYEMPRIACCIASIVLAILAIILPLMVVPALIVCAAAAVFFALEELGYSPLTNASKGGVSQNVIAKYYPGMSVDGNSQDSSQPDLAKIDGKSIPEKHSRKGADGRAHRKRKIIILARYDSGRVHAELKQPFIGILDKIQWAEIAGMALIPIALLLRLATGAGEEGHIVWDIFVGIGAFCGLIPVIIYIMHQTAPYSEGANNNASGVAVMTEVAKRIVASSKPKLTPTAVPGPDGLSFSLPAEEEDPTVIAAIPEPSNVGPLPILHGKDALENAAVLPVETDLIYEASANGTLESETPQALAARAEKTEQEISDRTVAFTPVASGTVGGDGQVSERRSALSLEEQMQNASQEFAKFDNAEPEEEKNPWIRLQNQSHSQRRERPQGGPTPDVTADMRPVTQESTPQQPADDPNVPDWFKKGMAAASANKPEGERESSVQRSVLADALDAAHETSAQAMETFEEKAEGHVVSNADRARIDELQAKIMGEASEDEAAIAGAEISSEAKAARRAKLVAARDAKNAAIDQAARDEVAAAILEGERLEAEELESEAQEAAIIDVEDAAASLAQAHAAEEVAEQAAVADRTISFIPVAADMHGDVSAKTASETSSHEPIKKTAEEILDDAASLTASSVASEGDAPQQVGRRSISLPSLTVSKNKKSGVQNAPLAEDAERGKNEGRTALKNVGGQAEYGASKKTSNANVEVKEGVSQSLEGATTSFLQETEGDALAALSSLDGSKSAQAGSAAGRNMAVQSNGAQNVQGRADAPITVSTAGSFVRSSQTSNFEPVGDELIANVASEDIIIEDVDDSDYTDNITSTGAIAGPGYVEMPKSRMSRIKSLFGKKKSKGDDSISFADAVGVDADFDAREVGAARGGWESFKNDSANFAGNQQPQQPGNVSGQPPQAQMRQAPQGQMPQGQVPQGQVPQGQMPRQNMQGVPMQQGNSPQPNAMSQNMSRGNSQNLNQGSRQMPMQQNMQQPRQMNPQMQNPSPFAAPQGQPSMPRRMPQQGAPAQGSQQPFQGQAPQTGVPQGQMPQGQMPQQFQVQQQMQFSMQAQQTFQVQQGQVQAQGANNAAQSPMAATSLPQVAQNDAPQEGNDAKAAKKSRSFSFFKRNKDGDMNSGAFDDDDWNGGAFSLGRGKDGADDSRRQGQSSRTSRRSSRGQGASTGRRRSADEVLAEETMADMEADELMAQDMLDERDQIRNFRSSSTQMTSFEEVAAFASSFSKQAGDAGIEVEGEIIEEEPDIGFQTEVWFVALGAELANNAGVKNLLAEHGDELRGAVVIDIDALGAGQLSIIEEEGVLKHVKSSSRMRRYATKAASALGINLGTGKMLYRESAAYYTTKRGLLTMHLCGMEDGKPAFAGEADDTFDKLSEETMLKNAAFMLELVNAI